MRWFAVFIAFTAGALPANDWPRIPARNTAVSIPAQEWPRSPGERTVRVSVHYPGGELANVGPGTGVMLSLHNWGGTDCVGTADPAVLAREFDVVALCVNYLQSGKSGPEPYDFGYLQSLDALRALWWMRNGLQERGQPFAAGRLYATGGSGGGNVTLMANKLAPRTFACVIGLSGMAKLSDDMAFDLPGGTTLNARYQRSPGHPFFLSFAEQEIRFLGSPPHLKVMKSLGNSARIVIVHGESDETCPVADARELATHLEQAGLSVEPHWITPERIGAPFQNTGHSLGNRTQIVLSVAGRYLRPDSPDLKVRREPTDFDLKEDVRYATSEGEWVISYAAGYPVGRFEALRAPSYPDRVDLSFVIDSDGTRRPVRTVEDWETRRGHVVAGLQQVMGPLPNSVWRVPLNPEWRPEIQESGWTRRKVTYQSDPDGRVPAWILVPDHADGVKLPAVLCLHQTTSLGKDEPVGLGGDPNLHYARELVRRGFVTLSPDYPSFGTHTHDFSPESRYQSGSMKAVWDNLRAVDLLESLEFVDAGRIGVIGHSLGGHSAIFTAVFEPRLKAVVSSCGFTRFGRDDLPSWTGPRYMPRISNVFQNDPARVPFDFPELIAAIAPRAFFASAARRDSDFDVRGVEETLAAVKPIFALHGQDAVCEAFYPDVGHGFPPEARTRAYEFLDRVLKRDTRAK